MTALNLIAAFANRRTSGRALWQMLSGRWTAWRRLRRSRRALDGLTEDQLIDIGLKRTPTGYDAQTDLRASELRLMRGMSETWGIRL